MNVSLKIKQVGRYFRIPQGVIMAFDLQQVVDKKREDARLQSGWIYVKNSLKDKIMNVLEQKGVDLTLEEAEEKTEDELERSDKWIETRTYPYSESLLGARVVPGMAFSINKENNHFFIIVNENIGPLMMDTTIVSFETK